MSLDGLRAWIGEVERKLGVRTRVFLVLTAIAIGGAGAGIYLALEASDEATGEADVSALEERIDQLEAQSAGEPSLAPLERQVRELREQVERLESKGTAGAAAESGTAKGTGGATAGASGTEGGGVATDSGAAADSGGVAGGAAEVAPPASPSEKSLPDPKAP